MKKQISIILLFLFPVSLAAQEVHATFDKPKKGSHLPSATSVPNPPVSRELKTVSLATIDSIVKDGIESNAFPGCQVMVLKDGKPYFDKCYGYYTYDKVQKVEPTTMYDLASMTKTTATLLAVMKLYDDKRLSLSDKASRYLTFLQGTDKENITITELLFHESGLVAGLPFYRLILKDNKETPPLFSAKKDSVIINSRFKEGWVSDKYSPDYTIHVAENFFVNNRFHEEAMKMIARSRLNNKVYVYSDLNFILLKEIVETISGKTLDVFVNDGFYAPMKLKSITYCPLLTHKKEEIAPTVIKDFIRGRMAPGYVHDDSAAFMGGISGNAGLFANAADVAKVFQMILNGGEIDGIRYISKETCRIFTTTTSASGRRGLGFDKPVPTNPRINPCCISAPSQVYGHTGYTGTCYWVDPVNNFVYVFLSNRVYPNDGVNKLSKMQIRSKIQEVIYQSIK